MQQGKGPFEGGSWEASGGALGRTAVGSWSSMVQTAVPTAASVRLVALTNLCRTTTIAIVHSHVTML